MWVICLWLKYGWSAELRVLEQHGWDFGNLDANLGRRLASQAALMGFAGAIPLITERMATDGPARSSWRIGRRV